MKPPSKGGRGQTVYSIMENVNPEVFKATKARPTAPEDCIDDVDDEIDGREIFGESRFICATFLLGHNFFEVLKDAILLIGFKATLQTCNTSIFFNILTLGSKSSDCYVDNYFLCHVLIK